MSLPSITQTIMAVVVAIIFAIVAHLVFEHLAVTIAIGSVSLLSGLLAHLDPPMPAAIKAAMQDKNGAGNSSETTTLFVGNLAFRTTPDELQSLFSPFGPVHSLRIMKDRMTRRPRGFAFVELSSRQAQKAIRKLHDSEFNGRKLKVNESNKSSQQSEG